MVKIILDTDPGIDDALAFMMALSSPELEIKAITTVDGNVSQEKGHRNAKQLLEFLKRDDMPVAQGAKQPLLRKRAHAEEFHGKTGLGEAVLPEPKIKSDDRGAVRLILDNIESFSKELTLVAIGPLTNIASALLVDPKIATSINGLVIMGGAFNLTPYGYGNTNAVAEFNIWHDPEAAKIVFNSGMPIVCAGLDTTTFPSYRLSLDMFNEIKKVNSRRSNLIVDLLNGLVNKYNGMSLHDPMALAYTIDSSIFKLARYNIDIETLGELTMGMTVIDRRRRVQSISQLPHDIIVEVDAQRFHSLFMDRVLKDD